jgi:hypothetical protein
MGLGLLTEQRFDPSAPFSERLRWAIDRLRYSPAPGAPRPPSPTVPNIGPARASRPAKQARPALTLPPLDYRTVGDALGHLPDPHELTCLRWDVGQAIRALENEIATGTIAPGVRLIAGRPLSDWLQLDEVARLLRAARERPETEA